MILWYTQKMLNWIFSSFFPKPSFRVRDLHRIALICYGGLGDVLLFSPVIQELRHHLPNIHISLYVEARSAGVGSVLEGVDAILSMPVGDLSKYQFFKYLVKDLKMRHFDAVISTGRNPFIALALTLAGISYRVGYDGKSWARSLLTFAAPLKSYAYASVMHLELAKSFLKPVLGSDYKGVGVAARPHIKPLDSKLLESMQALKIPRLPSHRKHILIHPGVSLLSQAKGIYKGWQAESWADFILNLSRDHAVYLIGGPDDTVMIDAILNVLPEGLAQFKNLSGQSKSFEDLAGLMAVMDLLCVVDSAPLHLAVGLQKPTVAFFGPTNAKLLLPPDSDAFSLLRVVQRQDLSCQPCLWQDRQQNCESSDCLNVSPTLMIQAVYDLIEVAYSLKA
jgi:ADP-heptose:LPS heptosyltransferase